MSFLFFLCLFYLLCVDLRLFNAFLADILGLLLLELGEFTNLLLLHHNFVKTCQFLLLLNGHTARSLLFFDGLNLGIEVLSLTLFVLISVILGSLLSHLQFDFEGVERPDNGLISIHLVFLLSQFSLFFTFDEFFLTLLSLSILKSQRPQAPILLLFHVGLERLH